MLLHDAIISFPCYVILSTAALIYAAAVPAKVKS
jgi:hypothetical protein